MAYLLSDLFPKPCLSFFGLSWNGFLLGLANGGRLEDKRHLGIPIRSFAWVGDNPLWLCLCLIMVIAFVGLALHHCYNPGQSAHGTSVCCTAWLLVLVPSWPPVSVPWDLRGGYRLQILSAISFWVASWTHWFFSFSKHLSSLSVWFPNMDLIVYSVEYLKILTVWIDKQRPLSFYLCVAGT